MTLVRGDGESRVLRHFFGEDEPEAEAVHEKVMELAGKIVGLVGWRSR